MPIEAEALLVHIVTLAPKCGSEVIDLYEVASYSLSPGFVYHQNVLLIFLWLNGPR